MKKIIPLFWIMIVCMVCFAGPLFADKVVLKSGKTLDVKLIERPDNEVDGTIVVDMNNQRLMLDLNDIRSINGEEPRMPGWKIWINGINGYLGDVEDILTEGAGLSRQFYNSLKLKILTLDPKRAEMAFIMGKYRLSGITGELKSLIPPEGLDKYHEKAIEISENREALLRSLILANYEAPEHYMNKEIILYDELIKEIRRLYLQHGVPRHILGTQDWAIKNNEELVSCIEAMDAYDKSLESGAQGNFKDAENGLKKILEKPYAEELKTEARQLLSVIEDRKCGLVDNATAAALFKSQGLLNKMDPKEAASEAEKAISLNPGYYYGYALLSDAQSLSGERLYFQSGDIRHLSASSKEITANMEKTLQINPDYTLGYLKLAYFSLYLGRKNDAIENLRKAADLMKIQNDPEEAEETEHFIERLSGKKEEPISSITTKPCMIDTPDYLFYIPKGIDPGRKHPLVIALSPNADAGSMMELWRPLADRYGWLVYASKIYKNGLPVRPIFAKIIDDVYGLRPDYPIDTGKIVAAGMSGGGMGAHLFCYYHGNLISAVLVNTGIIHELYRGRSRVYPRGKIAVFLASPTDYRYKEMKEDRRILESLGWDTNWIEFRGGHIVAPSSAYKKAVKWIDEKLG